MTTLMILIAQYGAVDVLPFHTVAKDLFGITPASFLKNLKADEINSFGENPASLKALGVPLLWIAWQIESRRGLARDAMNNSTEVTLNNAGPLKSQNS